MDSDIGYTDKPLLGKPISSTSMKPIIYKLLYSTFFIWFGLSGLLHPLFNYDMLPYVGTVLSYSEDEGHLRQKTLLEINKHVSPEQYDRFTKGSHYTETVAKEDRAFLEQLPGYKIKPLYILLTAIVGHAIDNIPMGTVIVSSSGFALIGVALYLFRPQGKREPLYLISVLLVFFLGTPSFNLLPSVSTPDTLAAGLILLSFWLFFHNPRSVYSVVLMSLAVLARPDSIITTACFLPIFIKHFNDRVVNFKWLSITLGIPALTYLCSKFFFPSMGIKELIVFAIKGPYPYLSSIDTTEFRNIYFSALFNDVFSLLHIPRFTIFLCANILLLFFLKNRYARLTLLAALGNICLKIVLFPNFDGGMGERFFFTSYLLILVAIFMTPPVRPQAAAAEVQPTLP